MFELRLVPIVPPLINTEPLDRSVALWSVSVVPRPPVGAQLPATETGVGVGVGVWIGIGVGVGRTGQGGVRHCCMLPVCPAGLIWPLQICADRASANANIAIFFKRVSLVVK